MDILTIKKDIEKLSERAEEIDTRKDNKLVQEIVLALKNKIRERDLAALSAPQIGYNKRIFCINFNGDIRTFINPIITAVKGFELSREKCSSIPKKEFIRPRHNNIDVCYMTPLGKIESRKFLGLAAKVFQHHMDHLEGLLLSDIGLEIDADFDKASEEEKQKIIDMYLDSLDIKRKDLNTEVEADPELKKTADAIDFMTKLQRGEVRTTQVTFDVAEDDNNNKAKEEEKD